MRRLEGRVGLITGTASGIGKAGALLFAEEGAALVTMDVENEAGRNTVEEIIAAGGRALFSGGDVGRAADVQAAVLMAVQAYGKLDLIWSNAAIFDSKTAPDTSLEDWDRIMDVNVKGTFLLVKYGIPKMIEAGGGTIVVTGSTAAVVGYQKSAAYCASKGAVLMLSRALALDHASDNIRVNCVCPGATDTPAQQRWLREHSGDLTYQQALAEDQATHPMNRYATPEEIATAALYLASDESSFITGTALFVDGGYSTQ